MIKTIFVSAFLLFWTVTVRAQTDDSYIVPHRGVTAGTGRGTQPVRTNGNGVSHINPIKRMGWNNAGVSGQITTFDLAVELKKEGETAFHEGNLSAAEASFRSAIAVDEKWTTVYEALAKVLIAQGRTAEAIQTYRTIFYTLSMQGMRGLPPDELEAYRAKVYQSPVQYGGSGSASVLDGLSYSLLLIQTGQWPEAVTIYKSALLSVPGGDLPKLDIQFDSSKPQPVAFEAITRIALGLSLNFSADPDRNQLAMLQYSKALQLEPDWGVANYYYGYGWNHLDLKDKVRLLNAAQAKAALQKAVKIGNAEVKKAAERALKNAG